MPRAERHEAATLVLGTGLAGLYAALRAAERAPVVVATKGRLDDSASFWAQGGVAAAVGEDDTVELHEADTLRVGRGLCRPAAVELLTEEAPRHIERLRDLGVDFELEGGELELALEAGHSRRRIAHAGGGSTGRVIVETLVRCVLDHANITVLDEASAWSLIADGERCYGAHTSRGPVLAGTTILATGGAASLHARSTNPPGSRGEGMAFAWRAGAALVDMEFVQFHPTALVLPGPGNGFLVSEAVRGEGAHLLDRHGHRFMPMRHEAAELAPRDVLARAIVDEMQRTAHHCVYLSLAHLDGDRVRSRFSAIADRLDSLGIDIARDPLPVAPAAHYVMGGVLTDLEARTNVEGLLACGEVACTGVHGANRLASNSLLECLVFADRAGAYETGAAAAPAALLDVRPPTWGTAADDPQLVRELMWRCAGVARTRESLDELAVGLLGPQGAQADARLDEMPNEVVVATLVGRAAMLREESRGAHFRSDFPQEDESWCRHVVQRRGSSEAELVEWR